MPGHAAQRGGLADRAAGVRGGGDGREPRGDRGGRTARGAAGHHRRVPGIAHRPEVAGLVGRAHGELVHVRLAEHHRAGGLELGDHSGVIGRDEVVEHARAAGGADPSVQKMSLCASGTPVSGPPRPGGQRRVRRLRSGQRRRRA